MEAAAEYEGQCPDREKLRERRDKERRKEMAKVEKEKESDEGSFIRTNKCPTSVEKVIK